jgi:hypothetical protein
VAGGREVGERAARDDEGGHQGCSELAARASEEAGDVAAAHEVPDRSRWTVAPLQPSWLPLSSIRIVGQLAEGIPSELRLLSPTGMKKELPV